MTDRDSMDRWLDTMPWWQEALIIVWVLTPIFAVFALLGYLARRIIHG